MVVGAPDSGGAMAGAPSGQPGMANLRASELTWNPDTNLLMSKLNDVKDQRESDNFFDTNLRHLMGMLNLQFGCVGNAAPQHTATTVFPKSAASVTITEVEKDTVGTPPVVPVKETVNSAPDQVDAADDVPTLDLSYPPRTRDDKEMAQAMPNPDELKPPSFSQDTPYNSPRSSKRKQNDASSSKSKENHRKPGILNMGKNSLHKRRTQGNKFTITEEDGVVPDDTDSDGSFPKESQKPPSRRPRCFQPFRWLVRA